MKILGIETSCDDTGVAIYDTDNGLLAHGVADQLATHAEYGGVVPELAARDHIRKLSPLVQCVLDQARLTVSDMDGVAYTRGPGLAGALLVGAGYGRSLAWALDIPSVGVHHMEGHLLAPMLEENPPAFPFLALLVSGGHTLLADVQGLGRYRILGESLDDAAGEAFDKTAKLLGLGYPGGPVLAQAAEQGNPQRFRFPRPMCDRPGLDFSFSGLKTFALTTIQNSDDSAQTVADIAWAFQDAVADVMVIKCRRALQQTGHQRLVVAGGVSANSELRKRLAGLAADMRAEVFYPRLAFCTDNGAMIAYAGAMRLLAGERQGEGFDIKPRWPISDIS